MKTRSVRSTMMAALVATSPLVPCLGATHYDGVLDLSIPDGRIEASWRIETEVAPATDSLGLLLNARQEVVLVEGDSVEDHAIEPTGMDGIQRIRVDLTADRKEAGPVILFVTHEGPLFDGPDPGAINRIADDWIELGLDSFWHPVFETFDRPFTARLTLELPSEWVVVASGEAQRIGDLVVLDNRTSQVDLAFVASPELEMASSDGSTVYAPDRDDPVVDRVLETAEACAESLNRDFGGSDRLPDRRFVLAPRDESGYARKNYVVLSRVSERPASAMLFLCHELAHFWSTRGHPMTVENWLNESFAEYAALRVVRERLGEETYREIVAEKRKRSEDAPPVWTPESTKRGPHASLYLKGPVALADLEAAIGREAFDRFFVRSMTDSFATTPELLEVLEEVAGEEARSTFEELLAR